MLIGWVLAAVALGQSLASVSYPVDGWASPSVTALEVDQSGFLWVGTQKGLLRYDGRRFERLPSAPEGMVTRVADVGGRVWVTTHEGTWRQSGLGFERLALEDEVQGGRIVPWREGVAIDAGDKLFYVDENGEAQVVLEGLATSLSLAALPGDRVALSAVGQGVWIVESDGSSALVLEAEEARLVPDGEGILVGCELGMYRIDRRGGDYAVQPFAGVGATTVAVRYDGVVLGFDVDGTVRSWKDPDDAYETLGRVSGRVWAFADAERALWVSVEGHGVARIDPSRGEVTELATLGDPYALHQDPEGGLWLGTNMGLVRAPTPAIDVWGEDDGLPGMRVYGMDSRPDGPLVVGGRGGLGVYRPGTGWSAVEGPRLGSVVLDGDRVLGAPGWRDGLVAASLEDPTPSLEALEGPWGGASARRLYTLGRTGDGTPLIVRSDGGLARIESDGPVPIRDSPDTWIRYIAAARDGGTWLTAEEGLYKEEAGRVWSVDLPGVEDPLYAVAESAAGVLWLSTSTWKGVLRVDPGGAVERYDRSRGMPSDAVYAALGDPRGDVWLGSSAGLVRISEGQLSVLTTADGLPWNDVGSFGLHWFDDALWVGTGNGLARIRPELLDLPAPDLSLVIEEIELDGVPLASAERHPHTRRDLEIAWAAPAFSDPPEVRYRLTPMRTEWSDWMDADPVRITNLTPGAHRLELQARAGERTTEVVRRSFRIAYPWWQTWWARGLGLLGLGGLAYGAHLGRTSALRRRKRLLQAEVEERTEEVRGLNDYLTDVVLGRFLPPTLVARAKRGELDLDFSPESREVTVLFVDLVGFTALAEELDAEGTAPVLNQWLTEMSDAVLEQGGVVDKFIGDCVMALFGAPEASSPEAQAAAAVAAARGMLRRAERLSGALGRPLAVRVSIHQGAAVVGNFGSSRRSDYTAVGPTVNLASRLQGVTGPGEILVSEVVAERIGEEGLARGPYTLKGVSAPVRARLLPAESD